MGYVVRSLRIWGVVEVIRVIRGIEGSFWSTVVRVGVGGAFYLVFFVR